VIGKRSKAVGLTIAFALSALGLTACGSGAGDETTTQRPPLSAATADHLAKLSDRIATDLDAGATCDAAHAADDLVAAVEEANLSATLRPGVEEVASRLVDEVNCPPPPPPPEPEKKKKEPKQQKGEEKKGDQEKPKPPGNGGTLPPGKAKLKGEAE
jgi:hypothetical protein